MLHALGEFSLPTLAADLVRCLTLPSLRGVRRCDANSYPGGRQLFCHVCLLHLICLPLEFQEVSERALDLNNFPAPLSLMRKWHANFLEVAPIPFTFTMDASQSCLGRNYSMCLPVAHLDFADSLELPCSSLGRCIAARRLDPKLKLLDCFC